MDRPTAVTRHQDDRVPPHNVGAEEAVLGAALVAPEAAAVAAGLDPADMYRAAHKVIVAAIRRLVDARSPVDIVTVGEELRRTGEDAVAPNELLHDLQNATPSISAAGHYAGIVRDTAALRRLLHVSADIADIAYNATDPSSALAGVARIVDGLAASNTSTARRVELIDWSTIHTNGDDLVEGLVMPGRWTAMVAGPKAGKTTLEMHITVELSVGRDPFDGTERDAVAVLYIDGEMGRFDLEQRIYEHGHDPSTLPMWHASDTPPRLDTIEGGAALLTTAEHVGAEIVVIDGINGTVNGAENDDTTWRAFYDHTIFPLKRAGIAIITGDNLGKDHTLGPRGSSVKVDKADAVIKLTRTEHGVRLTTTHRRTSAYVPELLLSIEGIDGGQQITYRRTGTAWPDGTIAVVNLLDELGIPPDDGRDRVRQQLNAARATTADEDRYRIGNNTLSAAIRYRRNRPNHIGDSPEDNRLPLDGTTTGTSHPESPPEQDRDNPEDNPGQPEAVVGTGGGVPIGTPPAPNPTNEERA